MTRSIKPALGLALLLIGVAARAATPAASPAPTCAAEAARGDRRSFTCQLPVSEKPQRFRFKANFSGGHDDTSASMALMLNEVPLACDPGSKTKLFGEDGDVSLECRFSAVGKAGTKLVLRVSLKWSHAQYSNFEIRAD